MLSLPDMFFFLANAHYINLYIPYLLVNQHDYGKLPYSLDQPTLNGHFPNLF